MLFQWWRNRRRQSLQKKPFPPEWLEIVRRNCRHFATLSAAEQSRLLRDTRWFMDEKSIEAAAGLALTDEMKVTVAVHASLLGLGFGATPFDRLYSVILEPDVYMGPQHRPVSFGAGLSIESETSRIGQAQRNGPVLLSWRDVLLQCRDAPSGRNVILHEFAHLLDMADADADGIPPLDTEEQYRTWKDVTRAEYKRLVNHVQLGRQTLLDPYGTASEVEFFAVATECFFEQSIPMQAMHPKLYDVLKAFYKQDPARRWLSLVA
jgi:Mlc titration factor MtfA (ptsG expression regulator)